MHVAGDLLQYPKQHLDLPLGRARPPWQLQQLVERAVGLLRIEEPDPQQELLRARPQHLQELLVGHRPRRRLGEAGRAAGEHQLVAEDQHGLRQVQRALLRGLNGRDRVRPAQLAIRQPVGLVTEDERAVARSGQQPLGRTARIERAGHRSAAGHHHVHAVLDRFLQRAHDAHPVEHLIGSGGELRRLRAIEPDRLHHPERSCAGVGQSARRSADVLRAARPVQHEADHSSTSTSAWSLASVSMARAERARGRSGPSST